MSSCSGDDVLSLVRSYVGCIFISALIAATSLGFGAIAPKSFREAELLLKIIGVGITSFGVDRFASSVALDCEK